MGMASMDEAKAFVESFRPWELYGGTEGESVEPKVRPAPGQSTRHQRQTDNSNRSMQAKEG